MKLSEIRERFEKWKKLPRFEPEIIPLPLSQMDVEFLLTRCEKLEEALRFYANSRVHVWGGVGGELEKLQEDDFGQRAREALEEK
jgi:hypothetical protein